MEDIDADGKRCISRCEIGFDCVEKAGRAVIRRGLHAMRIRRPIYWHLIVPCG
jgi:hypothetical protein